MNPLHLLWIIPLSCTAGVFVMAWCAANATSRMRDLVLELRVQNCTLRRRVGELGQ